LTRFAFIAPPFLGHLHPMLALAGELVSRGHAVTFLHMADAGPLVAGRGVEFRPVGPRSHPPGTLRAVTERMARIEGFIGLGGVLRDVAAATDMLCRELPDALRAIGADVVVTDQTEAAGGLVAAHLGLPVVSVANALPLNREPDVPPPFTSWTYNGSSWSRERNLGGYRVSDWLMRGHAEVIRRHAEAWRLGPRSTIEDCASPLAQVSQLVAGLDFPRKALPQTFHYCGPLRGGTSVAPDFRMPEPTGAPLVYASLGTLQGSRFALFRRIAEAARRLGVRCLLAHGGGLTDEQSGRLPGRPSAYAFVPQDVVLAGASLAVVNGGLNTVMDALARGVPVVVIPIAFEQAAIAARLARAGAGRAVGRRFLGPGRLTRNMGEVLREPPYREAAGRLAREIVAAGGVRHAADIVEAVARTGRPVTREGAAALPSSRPPRVDPGRAA
jgi:zeaxanthin glucosyltransferase